MAIDKNQRMINYLLTCPAVSSNPLFFNFGKSKEDNTQFIKIADNESLTRKYIDGSELKSYKFVLLTFKTISYNAIVRASGFEADENLMELKEFQAVIDWINAQEDLQNYPDFGTDCVVDEIKSLTANPVLEEVDPNVEPATATYSITIQVDYLDNSKKQWNKQEEIISI